MKPSAVVTVMGASSPEDSTNGTVVEAAGFRSPRPRQTPVSQPASAERSTGKGRRRRAAAEQRRREQEMWGETLDEDLDEMPVMASSGGARRRSRRALRRSRLHEDIEDYYAGHGYEALEASRAPSQGHRHVDELEIALALSLSLSENQGTNSELPSGAAEDTPADLSYETLVMLEDVRVVVPQEVVDALPICEFKAFDGIDANSYCELCTICQVEFIDGDAQMLLPCGHTLHDVCGEQWLCNYSKLCPTCKHEVA